jgi:hypothetical protein
LSKTSPPSSPPSCRSGSPVPTRRCTPGTRPRGCPPATNVCASSSESVTPSLLTLSRSPLIKITVAPEHRGRSPSLPASSSHFTPPSGLFFVASAKGWGEFVYGAAYGGVPHPSRKSEAILWFGDRSKTLARCRVVQSLRVAQRTDISAPADRDAPP